jgi:cytochrome c peroxidase
MRVPTLRNIASTAPYMHDGRFATLDAVLDHYARTAERARNAPHVAAAAAAAAAVAVAGIDPRLATFDLSARERADLIAFLRCLTSPRPTGALDVRTAGR